MRPRHEQLLFDLWTSTELIWVWGNLQEVLEITAGKVEKLINSSQNNSFSYWNYLSYKIEVKNGKISKIYFSVWENKFLVYLSYDFLKRNIKIVDYTETNKDDRENFIEDVSLRNLKILWIQRKVKVWYWEFKKNPNYFRYLWVDYNWVKNFIEKLLRNYHK